MPSGTNAPKWWENKTVGGKQKTYYFENCIMFFTGILFQPPGIFVRANPGQIPDQLLATIHATITATLFDAAPCP